MSKSISKSAENVFNKIPKVSGELFALTYGSIVLQLIKDYGDIAQVNDQLEKIGYNIGLRIIEEYLAISECKSCKDFRTTAESIAKYAFKMFLGITGDVINWNSDGTKCNIYLKENPFVYYVELPEQYKNLVYSNILCGIIRGALEMVMMEVQCIWVEDPLVGGKEWILQLELIKRLEAVAGEEYQDD